MQFTIFSKYDGICWNSNSSSPKFGVYMVYVTSSLLYSLNMMEFAETPVVAVQICS